MMLMSQQERSQSLSSCLEILTRYVCNELITKSLTQLIDLLTLFEMVQTMGKCVFVFKMEILSASFVAGHLYAANELK